MIVIELNAESDPINIEGESFKPVVVLNDNEVPLVYVPGMRGAQGWTPILSVVEDGLRRVHQVVDWTGSTGTKPVTGLYVGATGLVANIADAKDIRGAQGETGAQGWTPILSVVEDGLRRVHRVVDWTGSTGTKPVTGLYVGATGLVANIADAKDIRGAQGASGIAADEDFTTIAAFRFMYNY
jgi:hypothetical protein